MTTDYTPTTEQVRDGFRYDSEAEYHDPITPHHIVNGYEFDRWLAAHDAEVRKQVAEAIFNEEQKAFRAAGGEASVDTFRNGYCLGLQRARDIAEDHKEVSHE